MKSRQKGQIKMSIAAAILASMLVGCATPNTGPINPSLKEPLESEENVDDPVSEIDAGGVESEDVEASLGEGPKVKVAILLPLSGPVSGTGKALLNAATMAVFDAYDPRISLLPYDTKADEETTEEMTKKALFDGADIILGPLLSANVKIAGTYARASGVPLIGFSNDYTAAAPGQYVLGFLPENEVRRIVNYAATAGKQEFAGLFPEGRYGDQVREAYGRAVNANGAVLSTLETYANDAEAVFDPVKSLAEYDVRRRAHRNEVRFLESLNDDMTDEIVEKLSDSEVLGDLPFDTVIVPEGGALLRTLAPLLPFYEINPEQIKVLGTGLWNDESLLKEPPLYGAWFAAPEPEAPKNFMENYQRMFGVEPPRIATISYDAMSLVSILVREGISENSQLIDVSDGGRSAIFSREKLTDPNGFVGIDGLFRLLADGTNERALAILEISPGSFDILEPALQEFPAFGLDIRQAALPNND